METRWAEFKGNIWRCQNGHYYPGNTNVSIPPSDVCHVCVQLQQQRERVEKLEYALVYAANRAKDIAEDALKEVEAK